jgi:hypothetical protein
MRPALAAACLLAACAGAGAAPPPRAPFSAAAAYLPATAPPRLADARADALLAQCAERWRDARLDHFSLADPGRAAFRQRFFVCRAAAFPALDARGGGGARARGRALGAPGRALGAPGRGGLNSESGGIHSKNSVGTTANTAADTAAADAGRPEAIFFYLGNEADVTLYLNNSGLMWEAAPHHGALLVFAEHRYYGESRPGPEGYAPPAEEVGESEDFLEFEALGARSLGALGRHHRRRKKETAKPAAMPYLTSEQALADYAGLIVELRAELGDPDLPVIGFGGSYGGMLAAWMRMKYPWALDGAVAASAPIWTFEGEAPPADAGGFAAVVTAAASPAAGAAAACAPNARAAWATLFEWGEDAGGRARVGEAMALCGGGAALSSEADVRALAEWAQSAWDYLAMGNFPYASSYILNGAGMLPAHPVRTACAHLADEGLAGAALLGGLARAVGVFYNFSGALECLDHRAGSDEATADDGDIWDFQARGFRFIC